jgi:hypothetical protein
MKNILPVFIILSLFNVPLFAQGVSNTLEDKNELGVPKLKFHSFRDSKNLNLKLGAKKLDVKPFNSFQKNIGMYKGPNKILSKDSVSQDLILKKLPLGLVYNMPIARPQKRFYMPTVNPTDSLIHHHILRKKIDMSLLDQE